MAVRNGNAVLRGKFPRVHEGITPFELTEPITAADVADTQILLAEVPKNFTFYDAIALMISLNPDAIGVGVVADLGLGGADGVIISTIAGSIDITAGLVVGNAVGAGWRAQVGGVPAPGKLYLILDITAAATPGAGDVKVSGEYSAGLDRISP